MCNEPEKFRLQREPEPVTEPKTFRVRHDPAPDSLRRLLSTGATADAHKYRLMQARNLLTEAGYVEAPDGTWRLPGEAPAG
jgi:hypothetical protein